ncbi:hypothetical protein FUA23_08390 [Neolewinella aurantiaca]|uniref:Uncharacterized protein n=1 Tax=Neolewinella aurantiaca TaxID=2602767 RepID=A0A5C7FJD3_9BACT|nr:hypothetical protein [Neolewinella aurantiaca]TXF89965.1 hypothetical protein FUA23_08390 [Neolewinella aurantiaca]
MVASRKRFLKTLGGVGMGIMAGPLLANQGQAFSSSPSSVLNLSSWEEKHISSFCSQLRNADFPLPESAVNGFRPVRIIKRKTSLREYHFEYIAENGNRMVMGCAKGRMFTKSLSNA